MDNQNFQPKQVVLQDDNNTINTAHNITTYQAVLTPILDKKDGCYYTFLDYGEKVCIRIHLKNKKGEILTNNDGKAKALYRYFLKSQIKHNADIGLNPFNDPALVFRYYEEFTKPQFENQRPNVFGFYSYWVTCRDMSWVSQG